MSLVGSARSAWLRRRRRCYGSRASHVDGRARETADLSPRGVLFRPLRRGRGQPRRRRAAAPGHGRGLRRPGDEGQAPGRGRARGRPAHPRHLLPAQHHLHHPVRPRGHPRPGRPARRRARRHGGGGRHAGAAQGDGAAGRGGRAGPADRPGGQGDRRRPAQPPRAQAGAAARLPDHTSTSWRTRATGSTAGPGPTSTTSTPSTRPATCSSGRTSSSSSRRRSTASSTSPTPWRPSSSSMPDLALLSVIAIVLLALVFDFTNGFHDAANSIATVVSTRVLTPRMAVIWAALLQLRRVPGLPDRGGQHRRQDRRPGRGQRGGDLRRAGRGHRLELPHLVAGAAHLLVARAHRRLRRGRGGQGRLRRPRRRPAWRRPSCSSRCRRCSGWPSASCSCWPACGRSGGRPRPGSTACSAASSCCRRPPSASATAATTPRRPWASSPPCWSAPATSSSRPTATCRCPLWVVLAAYAAIALGTLSGGWRIVKTLGQRITALKPVGGFSAETAAACSLYLATFLGIPVSTTQTITGAIVGVGATRRLSAVRWGVAGRIVWAWVLTIPAAGADRGRHLRDHRLAVRGGRPHPAAAVVRGRVVPRRRRRGRPRRRNRRARPAQPSPAEPVEPAER